MTGQPTPSLFHRIEIGPRGSLSFRVFSLSEESQVLLSPWHDIPLCAPPGELFCICTTPAGSWVRYSVAYDEPFTPLRIERDERALRNLNEPAKDPSLGGNELQAGALAGSQGASIESLLAGAVGPGGEDKSGRASDVAGPASAQQAAEKGRESNRNQDGAGRVLGARTPVPSAVDTVEGQSQKGDGLLDPPLAASPAVVSLVRTPPTGEARVSPGGLAPNRRTHSAPSTVIAGRTAEIGSRASVGDSRSSPAGNKLAGNSPIAIERRGSGGEGMTEGGLSPGTSITSGSEPKVSSSRTVSSTWSDKSSAAGSTAITTLDTSSAGSSVAARIVLDSSSKSMTSTSDLPTTKSPPWPPPSPPAVSSDSILPHRPPAVITQRSSQASHHGGPPSPVVMFAPKPSSPRPLGLPPRLPYPPDAPSGTRHLSVSSPSTPRHLSPSSPSTPRQLTPSPRSPAADRKLSSSSRKLSSPCGSPLARMPSRLMRSKSLSSLGKGRPALPVAESVPAPITPLHVPYLLPAAPSPTHLSSPLSHFPRNSPFSLGLLPQTNVQYATRGSPKEQQTTAVSVPLEEVAPSGTPSMGPCDLPMQVIDISSAASRQPGEIYRVKPLVLMVGRRQGSASKALTLVAIDADDPMAEALGSGEDVEARLPGVLDKVEAWLTGQAAARMQTEADPTQRLPPLAFERSAAASVIASEVSRAHRDWRTTYASPSSRGPSPPPSLLALLPSPLPATAADFIDPAAHLLTKGSFSSLQAPADFDRGHVALLDSSNGGSRQPSCKSALLESESSCKELSEVRGAAAPSTLAQSLSHIWEELYPPPVNQSPFRMLPLSRSKSSSRLLVDTLLIRQPSLSDDDLLKLLNPKPITQAAAASSSSFFAATTGKSPSLMPSPAARRRVLSSPTQRPTVMAVSAPTPPSATRVQSDAATSHQEPPPPRLPERLARSKTTGDIPLLVEDLLVVPPKAPMGWPSTSALPPPSPIKRRPSPSKDSMRTLGRSLSDIKRTTGPGTQQLGLPTSMPSQPSPRKSVPWLKSDELYEALGVQLMKAQPQDGTEKHPARPQGSSSSNSSPRWVLSSSVDGSHSGSLGVQGSALPSPPPPRRHMSAPLPARLDIGFDRRPFPPGGASPSPPTSSFNSSLSPISSLASRRGRWLEKKHGNAALQTDSESASPRAPASPAGTPASTPVGALSAVRGSGVFGRGGPREGPTPPLAGGGLASGGIPQLPPSVPSVAAQLGEGSPRSRIGSFSPRERPVGMVAERGFQTEAGQRAGMTSPRSAGIGISMASSPPSAASSASGEAEQKLTRIRSGSFGKKNTLPLPLYPKAPKSVETAP